MIYQKVQLIYTLRIPRADVRADARITAVVTKSHLLIIYMLVMRFQTVLKSKHLSSNAVASVRYMVDTTGGVVTATLLLFQVLVTQLNLQMVQKTLQLII